MKKFYVNRYEILRGVTVSSFAVAATLKEKPVRVARLLREREFVETLEFSHWENVFIDERVHDWDWDATTGEFRYYSHCAGVGETVDVLLVYEIEYRQPPLKD